MTGAVNAIHAHKAGEFFDVPEDGDAIDLGAMQLDVVVEQPGQWTNPGAVHEFQKNPCLTTGSVNDDCHAAPLWVRWNEA